MSIENIKIANAIALLKDLVSVPSFSKEEDKTADLISQFLHNNGLEPRRIGNNVFALSKHWKKEVPVILLNSHHDTVRPVSSWQRDPFKPVIENDRLYGLGSNDAGACLVSLAFAFRYFNQKKERPFNLIYLASAEEEISGKNGVESVLPKLGKIDFGIVGEPTDLQMAVAEKGLLVIDAVTSGIGGHAARGEGENAIYKAIQDIAFLQEYQFKKTSKLLGKVKMSVTQINAGTQHNVVPDQCRFVIDIRTTEQYENKVIFNFLQKNTLSYLTARSFRLNSSGIPNNHPLLKVGLSLGIPQFGSPTLSDQALMSFPTVKIGPGKSERSHTADEFILIKEIKNGIAMYCDIIEGLMSFYKK